jgi:hypothetical protein
MRTQRMAISIATAALMLVAATPWAATLHGTVRVGNVFLDETGDPSTVQETYDLEEGFALSRIKLTGTFDPGSSFLLDLRDINLRSRAGNLAWRVPGTFKLTAGYDQNRYVFDPGRGITSERKDWRAGLQFTPSKWLALSGDVNQQMREGDRLAYPLGTASVLGTSYDDRFLSGQVTADIRAGRRGGGLSYRMTDYADELNPAADRRGQVVAARLYAPMPFWQKWNNFLRGSYGTRELSEGGLEYTMSSFQYTAVLQPVDAYEFRYALDLSRVEDAVEDNQTDRVQNDFDLTWFHRYGRVNAGYGYEMNDDDRTLTDYHVWRAGMTFRPVRQFTTRFDYTGRVKRDQEELTLLKDVYSLKSRAKVDYQPTERFTLSGDYTRRERELPDIGVSMNGGVAGAQVRFDIPKWGALSADYSHAIDEYVDRIAGFETESDIVTARAEVSRIRNLTLAGGVTYMDIGRDLDIEKSLFFVQGDLKFAGRFHLGAKYNCFNYDDYILLDRYYTANVVRVDLGYDL